MADGARRLVCDPSLMMRTRLFCGLYNTRSVPPGLRPLARAYCITLLLCYLACSIFIQFYVNIAFTLYWIFQLILYLIAFSVSFWTGDQYLYTFFSQNEVTDVTLDSKLVFQRFEKQMNKVYFCFNAMYCITTVLGVGLRFDMGIMFILKLVIPTLVLDILVDSSISTKFVVMGLFNCRLLVLRRRLERYGFRTVGGAPAQPYCQIYDEIWRGLDKTNKPLKLLLLLDFIVSCCRIIMLCVLVIPDLQWQELNQIGYFLNAFMVAVLVVHHLLYSFGHVALLESAAEHCDHMIVFTAKQLVKTPSASERARMYSFLGALERRGARYRVLRALPLNAQLVLSALGFCTAQVIVFFSMIGSN